MYRKPVTQTASIASGQTTSDVIRTRDFAMIGLILPAAFDGTEIAIHACGTPDGTFVPVYDSDGNAVSVVVAASRAAALSGAEADACAPFQFLKLVSNAGGGETAARSIGVALK